MNLIQVDAENSNINKTTCNCNHLTTFGGFYVQPNPLPNLTITQIEEGYTMLVTVLFALLCFAFGLYLFRKMDKADKLKVSVRNY